MLAHAAADIFPLDEEGIPELAADIRKCGLLVPIETLGGKILDGRRRMRACELAGVKPQFREVSPADPVAHVLSLNLHRRHLTVSQIAMVGARAREVYDAEAKRRQKAAGGDKKSVKRKSVQKNSSEPISNGQARDHAAKAVGVSGFTIDAATKVLKSGVPELAKAVDDGRMAVSRAAKLADEPVEVQVEEAATAVRSRQMQKPKPAPAPEKNTERPAPGVLRGVGVFRANEAINSLTRIPKNDGLRTQGFKLVTDWIRRNK